MNFITRWFCARPIAGRASVAAEAARKLRRRMMVSQGVVCSSRLAGKGGAGVSAWSIFPRNRMRAMKSLTEAAVRQYSDLGYYAPVPVLTRAEARTLRDRLETFEASGTGMHGAVRHKPHLLFTWLNELI